MLRLARAMAQFSVTQLRDCVTTAHLVSLEKTASNPVRSASTGPGASSNATAWLIILNLVMVQVGCVIAR